MKHGFFATTLLLAGLLLPAASAHPWDIVPRNAASVERIELMETNHSTERGGLSGYVREAIRDGGEIPAAFQPVLSASAQRRRIVIRQRLASLNANPLYSVPTQGSIRFQLFDNIALSAWQTRVRRDRGGALLWTGRLVGPQNGQVVLVVRNRKVYASFYLPSVVFQIRPVEGGLYIIRELKYPDAFSDGSQMLLPGERKMMELVNMERAAGGLPILQCDDRLAATARNHALDMALHDYSGHDRRDGRKFYQCIFDNGYPVSMCGENIAVGFATPEEAFEALISSSEHRANILNSRFTQMGVGYAANLASSFHHFWVQDFGADRKRKETRDPEWAALSHMRLFTSAAGEFLTPGASDIHASCCQLDYSRR